LQIIFKKPKKRLSLCPNILQNILSNKMKKTLLLSLSILTSVFYTGKLIAQNHNHNHVHSHNEQSDVITDEDLKSISGFDEAAAIKELKTNGILDS